MLATILTAAVALFVLAFASVLAAVFGTNGCGDRHRGRGQFRCPAGHPRALPRALPRRRAPPRHPLAGARRDRLDRKRPWPLQGARVRSGVNRHGCCAGPMQFNLTDGPPSTWKRYAVDGNDDGRTDVYDA